MWAMDNAINTVLAPSLNADGQPIKGGALLVLSDLLELSGTPPPSQRSHTSTTSYTHNYNYNHSHLFSLSKWPFNDLLILLKLRLNASPTILTHLFSPPSSGVGPASLPQPTGLGLLGDLAAVLKKANDNNIATLAFDTSVTEIGDPNSDMSSIGAANMQAAINGVTNGYANLTLSSSSIAAQLAKGRDRLRVRAGDDKQGNLYSLVFCPSSHTSPYELNVQISLPSPFATASPAATPLPTFTWFPPPPPPAFKRVTTATTVPSQLATSTHTTHR